MNIMFESEGIKMKRIISVFLTMVLIFFLMPSNVVAEEYKELTFRGIEFGSNIFEVINKLKEDIGECREEDETFAGSSFCVAVKVFPKELYVAGYQVDTIELFFPYTDNEECFENCIFSSARYNFKTNASSNTIAEERYNMYKKDITDKLSHLYGKQTIRKSKVGFNYNKTTNDIEDNYYWVAIEENPSVKENNLYSIDLNPDFYIPYILDDRTNAGVMFSPRIVNQNQFVFSISYFSSKVERRAKDLRDNDYLRIIENAKDNYDGL